MKHHVKQGSVQMEICSFTQMNKSNWDNTHLATFNIKWIVVHNHLGEHYTNHTVNSNQVLVKCCLTVMLKSNLVFFRLRVLPTSFIAAKNLVIIGQDLLLQTAET